MREHAQPEKQTGLRAGTLPIEASFMTTQGNHAAEAFDKMNCRNIPGSTVMKNSNAERTLFLVLVCIGLSGLLLSALETTGSISTLDGLATPVCSDLLLYFGGIGSTGLLCTMLFGRAGVERTNFWVFLAGIVGAVVLFVHGM